LKNVLSSVVNCLLLKTHLGVSANIIIQPEPHRNE
jgi:hypothetical protein